MSLQSPEPTPHDGSDEDTSIRARDARLHSRAKSHSTSGRPPLHSNASASRQPLLGAHDTDNEDGFPSSAHGRGRSSSSSSQNRHSNPHAILLRSPLLIADPFIYYLAIFFDLLLRFTWSLKLSSHLHSIHEIEQGVFMLEALEVIRRWMWVYLRVEWESCKKQVPSRAASMNGANGLAIGSSIMTEDSFELKTDKIDED